MTLELNLSSDEIKKLESISKSRTEPYFLINRAKIILDYSINKSITSASQVGKVVRSVAETTIKRVKELGLDNGINDRKRIGRPKKITSEAQAWVISLACQKPKELLSVENNPYELWTLSLLAKYIRENCHKAGYPCLSMTKKGNLHNILNKNYIKPHKIKYYLEKRDKNHEIKKKSI